jgi:alkylation response protein AidB-like acyl-CoA dehydrogenase
MNERVTIGAHAAEREDGLIGATAKTWRERPELRTPGLHDRLLRLWVDAEALRLTAERLRQGLAAGQPGPEGSAAKLTFANLNQAITGLDVELHGEEGLSYQDWTMRRPTDADWASRDAGFRYLRMKGNSIEGGTSEILRNIIADRILQLPKEPRGDVDIPWKDLPR